VVLWECDLFLSIIYKFAYLLTYFKTFMYTGTCAHTGINVGIPVVRKVHEC